MRDAAMSRAGSVCGRFSARQHSVAISLSRSRARRAQLFGDPAAPNIPAGSGTNFLALRRFYSREYATPPPTEGAILLAVAHSGSLKCSFWGSHSGSPGRQLQRAQFEVNEAMFSRKSTAIVSAVPELV